MLKDYQFILWDFDGVIIDSDKARVEGFRQVLKEYPKDETEKLIEFHARNGGLSRYVKFRYFFEEIRKENITEQQVLDLANSFSAIMRETLTSPELLIRDSVSFIQRRHQRIPFHIVSGSDGNELRFLCKELGVASMFRSIQGSPTPKVELVRNLIEQGHLKPERSCLIGDAGNDLDAAQANGIDFFGYNNPSLQNQGTGYITSFENE